MHALVIKGLRAYFSQVHGTDTWVKIAQSEGYEPDDFALRITADVDLADRFLNMGTAILDRTREDLLEDFGLFLTTHPSTTALRRLLRFSGPDFAEFLYGLPDMAPRSELAVPNLHLPRIDVEDIPAGVEVAVRDSVPGFEHVLVGIIRGMADDFGALVHVEQSDGAAHKSRPEYTYWTVLILDVAHSTGRKFTLTGDAA